jgi:hypothetical protein
MATATIKKNGRRSVRKSLQEQIDEQILEGLDLDDRMIQHAVHKYVEKKTQSLEEEIPEEEILHRIQTDEVISAIVQCRRAIIFAEADQRRLKISKGRAKLAQNQVVQAIGEFEDIDPDINWSLDINHLVLVKPDEEEEEEEKVWPRVISFSRAMASGETSIPLASIRDGEMPDEDLKKISGISDFFSDLADLLLETEQKGHDLVIQICDDPATATKIAQDENMPKPLRFLAGLVAKQARKQES